MRGQQAPRHADDNGSAEGQRGESPTNVELIQRFNTLQAVKPHFTVPKIKLAFNRNMTRIERALEPFHTSEQDLREEFEIPAQAPLFDEEGNPQEEIDEGFYERREEYLQAEGEPYEPYTVPERLLDSEPGQMADGRVGLPDGALTAVLWMFEE